MNSKSCICVRDRSRGHHLYGVADEKPFRRLEPLASWSFLTNHGLVLAYIGRYPDSTGLEIAQAAGITERAARRIVADLLSENYIERERVGRRNSYRLDTHLPLRHLAERTVTVGELLGLLWREENSQTAPGDGREPLNGSAMPLPRPRATRRAIPA